MTSVRPLLVRHLLIAAAGAAVALVAIVAAGWSPHVGYVATIATVLAVSTVGLRRLGDRVSVGSWPVPAPPRAEVPGVDPRVGALETLLRRSIEDPAVYERRLRPLLADLTTHRLQRDHGLDPAEHPEEARALLGPATWEVLTGDGPVTAVTLARAIEALERVGGRRGAT